MIFRLNSLLLFSLCLLFPLPKPEKKGYSEEGFASYYSEEFNGKKTASGEIFDLTDFTAAHRSHSFNTFLKVTNLQNNLSVLVRVNDRGPFVKNRILDLSEAAARKIGSYHHGFVKVKAGEIELAPLLPEQDSLFIVHPVVDCLGNIERLVGSSISIWSTHHLLHALYIANDLYLNSDFEKILICPRGKGNYRKYHVVISGMNSRDEDFKTRKYFSESGFMNIQKFR